MGINWVSFVNKFILLVKSNFIYLLCISKHFEMGHLVVIKRSIVKVDITPELNDKVNVIREHSGIAFGKKILPTVVDFINSEYEKLPEYRKIKKRIA